jgi:hypothetical protein
MIDWSLACSPVSDEIERRFVGSGIHPQITQITQTRKIGGRSSRQEQAKRSQQ